MAFNLSLHGGFGNGKLGDVTDPTTEVINAYAVVDDINTYNFLATPIWDSAYVKWENCVGEQVMLHGITGKPSTTNACIGHYLIATITDAVEESGALRITIDTSTRSTGLTSFGAGYWQAILVPQFKNLKLQSKTLKPAAYSLYNVPIGGTASVLAPCGGVIVFKCSETFTLAGAHIDLRNAGLSPSHTDIASYRPLLAHEQNGTLDTNLYSGCENSVTKDRLLVNAGDGACLIMASYVSSTSGTSRIGNPATSGVQYCRGASDSEGTPANVTNIGGSTIAVVANTWNNFTPNAIAKYRTVSTPEGRGLARAYLAIRNPYNNIKPDEGLYAQDVLPDANRVKSLFNLYGFGTGQTGTYTYQNVTPPKCFNQYAKVTAISGRVYTISKLYLDVESIVDWTVGAMVMIHQSRKSSGNDYNDGAFKLSRITAISGSTVTIKHNFSFNLSTYNVQMIVVPEFRNLTLQKEYKHTPQYYNGSGGICAIAVSGTMNFTGGSINTEGKGTFNKVVNPMLGNASMKGVLPLGQGNGSVLIIANSITMNTSSRIGGTYDGSLFGGAAAQSGISTSPVFSAQGGYKGKDGYCTKYPEYGATAGWGGGAGTQPYDSPYNDGGWFSSAKTTDSDKLWGCQGAHVMIIADTIDGLCLHALSTGGKGGHTLGATTSKAYGKDGGCGYGGGGNSFFAATASGDPAVNRYGGAGGYRGGGGSGHSIHSDIDYAGGGGSGSCFVYVNNITNQNNTNNILS